MAELKIQFDIRLSPNVLRAGLAVLFLSCFVTELSSESVTLSTYYPAPSGVYTQMVTTGNTSLGRDGNATVTVGASATPGGTRLSVLNGTVGIGTAAPGRTVEIAPPAGFAGLRIRSVNGSQAGIDLVGNGPNSPIIQFGMNGVLGQTSIYQQTGDLVLMAPFGGVQAEPMIVPMQIDVSCFQVQVIAGQPPATCGANQYATLATGVYVNRWELGNVASSGDNKAAAGPAAGDIIAQFLCCPYLGAPRF